MSNYLTHMLKETRCNSISEYLKKLEEEEYRNREKIFKLIQKNPINVSELALGDKLILYDKLYERDGSGESLRNKLYCDWTQVQLMILNVFESASKFNNKPDGFKIYDINKEQKLVKLNSENLIPFWKDVRYFQKLNGKQ